MMPQPTPEERITKLEEHVRALELALRSLVAAETGLAEDEGRDGLGSNGQSWLAVSGYELIQDEKGGDLNPRRRRIIDRAMLLLSHGLTELD